MKDNTIIQKLNTLPDDLRREAENFIDFLLTKINHPAKHKVSGRKFGSAKGTIVMKDNFDEPLEDFKEYTE